MLLCGRARSRANSHTYAALSQARSYRCRWWCLLVALVTLLGGMLPLRAERVLISHLHPSLPTRLAEIRTSIHGGEIARGLDDFQELYEEVMGEPALVIASGHDRPEDYVLYEPAARQLRAFLLSQSLEVLAAYRATFDGSVSAQVDRLLTARDADGLLRCAALYPAATRAAAAALAAGDLFLERAQRVHAARAWSLAEQLVEVAADPEIARACVARCEVLAVLTKPSGAQQLPQPKLRNHRAELLWGTQDRKEGLGRKLHDWEMTLGDAPYVLVPVVGDGLVHFATPDALHAFRVQDGALSHEAAFLSPASYRETDLSWRLRPAVTTDTVVSSYVAHVDPKQGSGRGSRVIRVPIPRRGLRALTFADDGPPQVLWDTEQMERDDPLFRSLSFATTPLVDEGVVYALAWRWSGYVDAYLVAFDLQTGRKLWQQLLVSGQVELTRFGEFAAEPRLGDICKDGDFLVVSTQLGVVSRLHAGTGEFDWVTRYYPVYKRLNMFQRRRLRYPYQPSTAWVRNPTVIWQDRVIVTPQDSPQALALDRRTGVILQRRAAAGLNNQLLGLSGDDLVFVSSNAVTLVPAADLVARGRVFLLSSAIDGRAALVEGGIVYTTGKGLCYRLFQPRSTSMTLYSFPQAQRRSRRSPAFFSGAVAVAADCILVANASGLRCFRLVPRSVQEPSKK